MWRLINIPGQAWFSAAGAILPARRTELKLKLQQRESLQLRKGMQSDDPHFSHFLAPSPMSKAAAMPSMPPTDQQWPEATCFCLAGSIPAWAGSSWISVGREVERAPAAATRQGGAFSLPPSWAPSTDLSSQLSCGRGLSWPDSEYSIVSSFQGEN